MKDTLIGFVAGLIAAALLTAAVHLYRYAYPRQSTVAAVAPELRRQKTETVAVGHIQAYRTPTKRELGLPQAVQASRDQYVIAATKAAANLHPQTVTAVLDTQTGQTQLYIRTDPLPWIAFEQHGDVSLSRGFRSGALIYRLAGHEDLVQIKAAHVGLIGSIDSDGQWYGGIGLRVAW